MAITQAGSTLTLPISSTANTGTVSTTITVPTCDIALVGVSGYQGTAAGFAAMTLTKGAADTAMTKVATGGDASNSFFQAGLFYLVGPDIGANKTLKWDWIGTGTSSSANMVFSMTFWSGIDTASPTRDSKGAQAAGTPYTTASMTAQSGDLIVAFAAASVGAEGTVDSWSNLTLLNNLTRNTDADAAWATGSPSGNTTVAASTDTNWDDGGICAVVLKPAAAAKAMPPFHRAVRFR